MEIICTLFAIGFVVLIGYYIMKESGEDRREKEAAVWIREMQAVRARQAAADYERQRVKPARSSPVYTGSQQRSSGSTPVKTEVKRHDNSFDLEVDTYTAPTYHSSHSTSSSSGGCD